MRYAVQSGLLDYNPAQEMVSDVAVVGGFSRCEPGEGYQSV